MSGSVNVSEILRIMRTGLSFVEGHLLEGERPLDAGTWRGDDLPSDEYERLLLQLGADQGLNERELRKHLGDPPIPADRRTHTFMSELLQDAFPGCYVVGEEATDDEWNMAEEAPPGSLIFSLDAIDGSQPYDTLTFGYSTNVLAFRRGADESQLLLAAVANSSQFVTVYESRMPRGGWLGSRTWLGSLRAGELDPEPGQESALLRTIAEPTSDNFREGTVAVVAASPRAMRLIRQILPRELADGDEPPEGEYTIFTTGGAPAALGLVLGRVEALAVTKPQTTYDAAYLPALASLNIPIITDKGIVLTLPDVVNFFQHVAISPEYRREHPIPRFVAARNPKTAATLARALFGDA